MTNEKITARFIIQIAGKPAQNVQKVLDMIKNKLTEDKNFKVLDIDSAEPELDEKTTLYSSFIDVGVKFSELKDLLAFIVNYTPNSVEIESPEALKLDAGDLTGMLNDISAHLLSSNMHIRNLHANIHLLQAKLKEKEETKDKKKK